jgi:hypothetical protein
MGPQRIAPASAPGSRLLGATDSVITAAHRAGRGVAIGTLYRHFPTRLDWSNGRLMDATNTTAPHEWRRQLYLMLDAYRADRAHPIPQPPMTQKQLSDAMVHLGTTD